MASSSRFCFGNRVLQGRKEADNTGKGSALCSVDDCSNAIMSSANVQLLEEFLMFCEAKKINLYNAAAQGVNKSCDVEAKAIAESISFRDDINTYFGDKLPASVIEALCNLVNDNTHGKCRSCKMPAESLVLGVLHILSDASQLIADCKENAPPNVASVVRANDIHGNSETRDFPPRCSDHLTRQSDMGGQERMKCTRVPNLEGTSAPTNENAFVSGGCVNLAFQNIQMNCIQQPIRSNEGLVQSKKSKVEGCANQGNGFVFSHEAVQGARSFNPVLNLSDESIYGIRTDPGQRFPVTKEDVRHYNAMCVLARSHWSGHKAVEYSMLTSVTYSSLGGSVQPGGKVDKYFVAGVCRYFFETTHPRQSKQHFFYPNVGCSLYTYNSPQDTRTVQKSFIGANSAYKLHSSHKLCFPIVIGTHWFVFLVDLKNHLFVFLDSFCDSNSNFLMDVSSKLINAFMECWHQYAEGYTCFDDFKPFYPEVPKHSNAVVIGCNHKGEPSHARVFIAESLCIFICLELLSYACFISLWVGKSQATFPLVPMGEEDAIKTLRQSYRFLLLCRP